jgi:hypothetical protein
MNGFGVLVSKKMGTFIATFEPRRRRMFAVKVLAPLVLVQSFLPFEHTQLTEIVRVGS